MCAGGAVVCVDDNHSDDDRSNDKDHGEEHVFSDEWNSTGGGGDQLNNHQQEHSQREQDRDAEGHLLTYTQHKTCPSSSKYLSFIIYSSRTCHVFFLYIFSFL